MLACSMRILVVEDETKTAAYLGKGLTENGFVVDVAHTGPDGEHLARTQDYDLILLDVMLPGTDGWTILQSLRKAKSTPVLFLSARGAVDDRVKGLELGADDYLVKPFAMTELVARIRALLRRTRPELVDERLEYAGIVLDRASHRVSRNGSDVRLGPTEYRLLDFLMQRPGRVFSRERLLDAVWGANTYVEARTVDVHVGRLRKALRRPGARDLIRTVRSAGYALDEHS